MKKDLFRRLFLLFVVVLALSLCTTTALAAGQAMTGGATVAFLEDSSGGGGGYDGDGGDRDSGGGDWSGRDTVTILNPDIPLTGLDVLPKTGSDKLFLALIAAGGVTLLLAVALGGPKTSARAART